MIQINPVGDQRVTITGTVKKEDGSPIAGVGIELCYGLYTRTNEDGVFTFYHRYGAPFCVRILENTLPPGYIKIEAPNTLNPPAPTYEHQRAGMDCRANPEGCSEGEKKYDLPRDDMFDFVVYYKKQYKYTKEEAIRLGIEKALTEVLGTWTKPVEITKDQFDQIVSLALSYARDFYLQTI